MRKTWTPEEVKILVDTYRKEEDILRLSRDLGRSVASIKHKTSRLGLKTRDGHARIRNVKGKEYWYICKDRKPIFLHRILASKMLGRPLNFTDIVHHIDGNSLNNQKKNLVVTTRSQHMGYHREQCIANLHQSDR